MKKRDLVESVEFVIMRNWFINHGVDRLDAADRALVLSQDAGDAWDYANMRKDGCKNMPGEEDKP